MRRPTSCKTSVEKLLPSFTLVAESLQTSEGPRMAANTHSDIHVAGPDIASYLDLIQYDGLRQPTLAVLHELHVKHTRSIPFENLSPFTGMAVDLRIDALMNKFTKQKRGGYCYEHNSLFQYVLQEMG